MASKIYLLVTLIAAVTTFAYGHVELPDYLHICPRSVPNMEECLNKSVETIRPFLIDGIPGLDIPKIDPMNVGDLVLSEKSKTNNAGLTIAVKDLVVQGASNFAVNKIDMVEFGKKYIFEVSLPQLFVNGRYIIDGVILVLPIKGAGKFTGNFTNCVGVCTATLEHVRDGDGETHVQLKKLGLRITVGGGRLYFENLFNGNKELSQIITEAINNNFQSYTKEVLPFIEKSLSKHFTKVGNKVIDRFTADQLYPKD